MCWFKESWDQSDVRSRAGPFGADGVKQEKAGDPGEQTLNDPVTAPAAGRSFPTVHPDVTGKWVCLSCSLLT